MVRRKPPRRSRWSVIRRAMALALGIVALQGLQATTAFADHTTRDQVISETGIDYVLVALVLVAGGVALVLFVAAVLWWERRDAEREAEPEPHRAARRPR